MRRGFKRTSFPTARKRQFEWTHTFYQTGAAAALGSVDLFANFKAAYGTNAIMPGCTVVRVRGQIAFSIPAATAPTVKTGAIVGLLVSDKNAAPVESPFVNQYMDYSLYQPVIPAAQDAFLPTSSGIIFGATIDAKAMRKISEMDETLWLTWNTLDGVLLQAAAALSCGLKLS
jgi:hypothetical protein